MMFFTPGAAGDALAAGGIESQRQRHLPANGVAKPLRQHLDHSARGIPQRDLHVQNCATLLDAPNRPERRPALAQIGIKKIIEDHVTRHQNICYAGSAHYRFGLRKTKQ